MRSLRSHAVDIWPSGVCVWGKESLAPQLLIVKCARLHRPRMIGTNKICSSRKIIYNALHIIRLQPAERASCQHCECFVRTSMSRNQESPSQHNPFKKCRAGMMPNRLTQAMQLDRMPSQHAIRLPWLGQCLDESFGEVESPC